MRGSDEQTGGLFVTDASEPRIFRIDFLRQVPAAASSNLESLE
jgi:hypothetical protein